MIMADDLTVTVEGRSYTLGPGVLALIRARRDHARGFMRGGDAPGHVHVLTELRTAVAQRLGVDRRTAALILREVPRG